MRTASKGKGVKMEKMQLEIRLDSDKRLVSSILVDNGYTVKKSSVVINGKRKTVLEAYKEE